MGKYNSWLQNLARSARRQVDDVATRSLEGAVRRAQGSGSSIPPRVRRTTSVHFVPVGDVLEALESFCATELWEWRCQARPLDREGQGYRYTARRQVTKRTPATPSGWVMGAAESWARARGKPAPWGDLVSVVHEFALVIEVRVPDPRVCACEVAVTLEERVDGRRNALCGGALSVPSLLDEFWVDVPLGGLSRRLSVGERAPRSGLLGLCHATLEGLDYERSGRYSPSGVRPLLSEEGLVRAHYAHCLGPLYGDEGAWRKAYQLVGAFTRRGRSSVRWTCAPLAQRVSGQVVPHNPADVLDLTCHALASSGLKERSRDDLGHTATFELVEACGVEQLPEPYGKWLQRQGRPLWPRGKVELELVVGCRVRPARHRNSDGSEHDVTALDLEFSAPAWPLALEVGQSLSALIPAAARPGLEASIRGGFHV